MENPSSFDKIKEEVAKESNRHQWSPITLILLNIHWTFSAKLNRFKVIKIKPITVHKN